MNDHKNNLTIEMVSYTIPLMKVVIDTNVLLSGLRSRNGASYQVLKMLYQDKFRIVISVPMILEYEQILKDKLDKSVYSDAIIDQLLDSLCAIAEKTKVFYLWRPYLKDSFDDHVLELALASESKYIVTYNKKDFKKAENLGIKVVDAKEFLKILEGETR